MQLRELHFNRRRLGNITLSEDGRTDWWTAGQTDGRYQVHYLPYFMVDNKEGKMAPCYLQLISPIQTTYFYFLPLIREILISEQVLFSHIPLSISKVWQQ